ncbi:MAG: TetR/AcrR family transcriptional regulator [Candidatus Abyssobacteria bacterium SURF_5]|uniref:TetR/AcrR family transcriptional regulator n=1 Tax=Abyssobacteria bacterium (strain SURF_5) TaxID=2093360 RepID=A0A3A4NPN1_ABYX5|nr:MAG: TetR/AcrR family transcriptional regulator [Candidatus Abyssubacteria bacterium SURF_5]
MARNIEAGFGRKRSQEAIQQRKHAMLKAAIKEFAKKGYADADLDHIAGEAKVGKGTIYRYYFSKEGLFHAVADDAFCRFRDFVFSALQGAEKASALEQIKETGRAVLTFFDENRVLVEIFLHERSQFRGMIHSKYLRLYSDHIHVFEDLVESCMRQGVIRRMDPRKLLDIVGDMLVGLVYMWGVRREKEPLVQKWSLVEETIFKGILMTR